LLFPDHPLPPEPPSPTTVLEPPNAPPNGRENPAWSFWDVVRIAVVAIIAIALFEIAATGIAAHVLKLSPAEIARHPGRTIPPQFSIPAQFAAYLLVIAYMVAIVHMRADGFWRTIRWRWPGTAAIGYLALGVAVAVIVQTASALLPIPKTLPIDQYFRSPVDAWLMAGFGVSFAPLMEELFFRGFLYPVIDRKWGVAAGVTITAALFALLHQGQLAHAWAPLLLIFFVGLVLTAVRAWRGSVATTFLIHVGYNATLFTMLYIASDHFRHLEKIS
jgi:membrane protease YdiL (CAAX protease family)